MHRQHVLTYAVKLNSAAVLHFDSTWVSVQTSLKNRSIFTLGHKQ